MGRKRKAKQDKEIKPKEYADICNIKTLKSGKNHIRMEIQLMNYGPSVFSFILKVSNIEHGEHRPRTIKACDYLL